MIKLERPVFNAKTYLKQLSGSARAVIIMQTSEEIYSDTPMPHSLQTLYRQNRHFALGHRVSQLIAAEAIGKPVLSYTGEGLVSLLVKEILKTGKVYYPINTVLGDAERLRQFVLFAKPSKREEYVPVARFRITAIYGKDETPGKLIKIAYVKTWLELTDIETENLPQDYLGNTSGAPIYDKAFRGQSPDVYMI